MTHQKIVELAVKWLYKKGCGYAVGERVSSTPTGEIPDAIGFKSDYSILIECKTSRADFRADFKKPFRIKPELGCGDFRFFLCEKDIIKADEVPDKWGLLYIENNKIIEVVAPKGNIWSRSNMIQDKNIHSEYGILYSGLRRIK